MLWLLRAVKAVLHSHLLKRVNHKHIAHAFGHTYEVSYLLYHTFPWVFPNLTHLIFSSHRENPHKLHIFKLNTHTHIKRCYSFIQRPFSSKKGAWGGSVHSKWQRCFLCPLLCHTAAISTYTQQRMVWTMWTLPTLPICPYVTQRWACTTKGE